MRKHTRRSFLATSASALAGSNLVTAADPGKNWIDSHVHVWTPELETYPISVNFDEESMKPASFRPTELFAHQEGTGVHRTVLVQMSFYEFNNSYMLDVMDNFPGRFGGIGIVNHAEKVVDKKMRNMAGRGVRGFRLYAFSDRVKNWDTSEGIQKMWKVGGEDKLAICCLTDPGALTVIRKMCEKYPDTPVVIDHFARVGMTGTVEQGDLDTLLGLAKFPNVHVKTSAYYALGKKAPPYTDLGDMIRQVRDAFGSERCMWGSDCPYQVQGDHTYEASLSLITERLDFLSDIDKENILRNTAEKLFFS